jgi:hypothetical protein
MDSVILVLVGRRKLHISLRTKKPVVFERVLRKRIIICGEGRITSAPWTARYGDPVEGTPFEHFYYRTVDNQ